MKKKRYIIIATIIVLCYIFFSTIYMRNKGKESYNYFYSSNINGKIEYIDTKFHGCNFKIIGIDKDFVFYPYQTESTERKIFEYFAKPNDSILKKAYNDTLALKKDGQWYYYTFEKIR